MFVGLHTFIDKDVHYKIKFSLIEICCAKIPCFKKCDSFIVLLYLKRIQAVLELFKSVLANRNSTLPIRYFGT